MIGVNKKEKCQIIFSHDGIMLKLQMRLNNKYILTHFSSCK